MTAPTFVKLAEELSHVCLYVCCPVFYSKKYIPAVCVLPSILFFFLFIPDILCVICLWHFESTFLQILLQMMQPLRMHTYPRVQWRIMLLCTSTSMLHVSVSVVSRVSSICKKKLITYFLCVQNYAISFCFHNQSNDRKLKNVWDRFAWIRNS